MPGIRACLQTHDMSFLRCTAELWGVNASGRDQQDYARSLAAAITSEVELQDMLASLPQDCLIALADLKQYGGNLPWTIFSRRYGQIRQMGPGKRSREKPHIFPISTAERLWYRALIGRDFIQQDGKLAEVAYVPDEFLPWLPETQQTSRAAMALVAVDPTQVLGQLAWQDRILDDSCTLLAALRRFGNADGLASNPGEAVYWQVLQVLLSALGLIETKTQLPAPTARQFLEMPRGKALPWLVVAWSSTSKFNELRLVPQLLCEGPWRNHPIPPRRYILSQLANLEDNQWYPLQGLIDAIYADNPDFLRQGGDYNAWIIARRSDKALLHGLESWQEVEAPYIHFIITGPLTWLGLIELGWDEGAQAPAYFRKSVWFDALTSGNAELNLPDEDAPVAVSADGVLTLTNLTPRIARYQLARFADWQKVSPKRYQLRLTPASLQAAAKQGLKVRHLVALLRKYAGANLPPSLVAALQRWEAHGREAVLTQAWVLQLSFPEVLQALRESPAASSLGEALSPVAVIVKPDGIEKVRMALARLGYLSDLESLPR
jgi:hypothetical protein